MTYDDEIPFGTAVVVRVALTAQEIAAQDQPPEIEESRADILRAISAYVVSLKEARSEIQDFRDLSTETAIQLFYNYNLLRCRCEGEPCDVPSDEANSREFMHIRIIELSTLESDDGETDFHIRDLENMNKDWIKWSGLCHSVCMLHDLEGSFGLKP